MRHVIHKHRAVHGLALLLAGFFSLQPTPLYVAEQRTSSTIADGASLVGVPVQGFWETVAQYAGR
jgi:hypothetical protein